MKFYKRIAFVAMALSVLATFAIPASVAPFPIQASAISLKAAAGNTDEAIILVYLANADGTPKTDAEIPKQGPDPNGGVEFKDSKWSFETLYVPPAYRGRITRVVRRPSTFDPGQTQQIDVLGQLRVMQVYPWFKRDVAGDPRAGQYVFRVYPRYGVKGGRKGTLPWVSGEYQFRISYKDGDNQGTALGVMTIR